MAEDLTQPTEYARLYVARVEAGDSAMDAAAQVADAYLDGKPRRRGKRKISWSERDAAFWSSDFLGALPPEAWHTESLVLALARYMGQAHVDNPALIEHLASIAPEPVKRAIRYSGLVLRPPSTRRAEVLRLAALAPEAFGDFVRVLGLFETTHRERLAEVDALQKPLAELSPLEFLAYASLFAFEYLVPRDFLSTNEPSDPDTHTQSVWDAINDLLTWKLRSAGQEALRLTERDIAKSLA